MSSVATATKPLVFSSVDAYQKQQDAKNLAQKVGLPMKTIEAIPGLIKRIEGLEQKIQDLEAAIDNMGR